MSHQRELEGRVGFRLGCPGDQQYHPGSFHMSALSSLNLFPLIVVGWLVVAKQCNMLLSFISLAGETGFPLLNIKTKKNYSRNFPGQNLIICSFLNCWFTQGVGCPLDHSVGKGKNGSWMAKFFLYPGQAT